MKLLLEKIIQNLWGKMGKGVQFCGRLGIFAYTSFEYQWFSKEESQRTSPGLGTETITPNPQGCGHTVPKDIPRIGD